MKTITYNGTVLEYKSSHRALYEYEKLAGKDDTVTYTDSLRLIFCIVKTQAARAGVKFDLDLEAFIDWLDAHPEALEGIIVGVDETKPAGTGKAKKK